MNNSQPEIIHLLVHTNIFHYEQLLSFSVINYT